MQESLFLTTSAAKRLYETAKTLPIADYHCHLSPKELFENRPFKSLASLWLSGDHYKWRLMRACGIDESLITGPQSFDERCNAYLSCVTQSPGNPLYTWTAMELSFLIGKPVTLTKENAMELYHEANEALKKRCPTPRSLVLAANVKSLATTDDPTDSLCYHEALRADSTFPVSVTPTFRTDRLVNIAAADYPAYIQTLSEVSGVEVSSFDTFKQAVRARLDRFCSLGCTLADVGVPYFPHGICTDKQADRIFRDALSGKDVSASLPAFLTACYRFLNEEYTKRNMTSQMHLCVTRNANDVLFSSLGADCGGDCMGDTIPVSDLTAFFNESNNRGTLPRTIVYTLNPAMYEPLLCAAGSFRNVFLGAAWWFNDHKAGIEQQLSLFARTGSLKSSFGMLTDSRSFLSYVRHDFFRRILCGWMGRLIESGEFLDEATAEEIVRAVCYENSASLLKGAVPA